MRFHGAIEPGHAISIEIYHDVMKDAALQLANARIELFRPAQCQKPGQEVRRVLPDIEHSGACHDGRARRYLVIASEAWLIPARHERPEWLSACGCLSVFVCSVMGLA